MSSFSKPSFYLFFIFSIIIYLERKVLNSSSFYSFSIVTIITIIILIIAIISHIYNKNFIKNISIWLCFILLFFSYTTLYSINNKYVSLKILIKAMIVNIDWFLW